MAQPDSEAWTGWTCFIRSMAIWLFDGFGSFGKWDKKWKAGDLICHVGPYLKMEIGHRICISTDVWPRSEKVGDIQEFLLPNEKWRKYAANCPDANLV